MNLKRTPVIIITHSNELNINHIEKIQKYFVMLITLSSYRLRDILQRDTVDLDLAELVTLKLPNSALKKPFCST